MEKLKWKASMKIKTMDQKPFDINFTPCPRWNSHARSLHVKHHYQSDFDNRLEATHEIPDRLTFMNLTWMIISSYAVILHFASQTQLFRRPISRRGVV